MGTQSKLLEFGGDRAKLSFKITDGRMVISSDSTNDRGQRGQMESILDASTFSELLEFMKLNADTVKRRAQY